MLIGYARVSTDEQDTRLQIDALKRAGCEKIYEERARIAHRSEAAAARARRVPCSALIASAMTAGL